MGMAQGRLDPLLSGEVESAYYVLLIEDAAYRTVKGDILAQLCLSPRRWWKSFTGGPNNTKPPVCEGSEDVTGRMDKNNEPHST